MSLFTTNSTPAPNLQSHQASVIVPSLIVLTWSYPPCCASHVVIQAQIQAFRARWSFHNLSAPTTHTVNTHSIHTVNTHSIHSQYTQSAKLGHVNRQHRHSSTAPVDCVAPRVGINRTAFVVASASECRSNDTMMPGPPSTGNSTQFLYS